MIYVANCGDSRAVLCRDGGALALTDDHKAAREDQTVSLPSHLFRCRAWVMQLL